MPANSTYVIVDVNVSRSNSLVGLIRQADNSAQFIKFNSVNECQTALCTIDNLNVVKGIFVRLDSNLSQISYFIDHMSAVNPNMYFIVSTDTMSTDLLRSLVQFRVSQILTPPYDLATLKTKMKMAENFQARLVSESKTMPAYRKFTAWSEEISKGLNIIYLIGWLADNCQLPLIRASESQSTLLIDCNLLDGISSIGVRTWLLWIKEMSHSGFNKFVFKNIRGFFMNHAHVVSGFLPTGSTVDSFYLKYFNESSEEEFEMSFRKGLDFDDAIMTIPRCIKVDTSSGESIYFLDEPLEGSLKFYQGKVVTTDKIMNYNYKKIS